jgi:hypothetical protein
MRLSIDPPAGNARSAERRGSGEPNGRRWWALRSAQPAVSHRGKAAVIVQWAVPLAANDRLDELYAVQRLVQAEVDRLQQEHDGLHEPPGRLRRYILNVQIEALQEEATRLSARISDVLERDLQR